jgi:hypothetical protein
MKTKKGIRTGTYRVSKIINAPLRFVYDWCTDFREDDYKMTGSKSRRTFLERSRKQVIYAIRYPSGGDTKHAVNIVTLHPPRSWHLDSFGEEDNEFGDYRLTRLGPGKTRLDMVFREEWKIAKVPPKAEYLKDINRIWDKYAAALEKDYKNRKTWNWSASFRNR